MNETALLPQTTQELEDHCAQLKRVEIEDADHWILHQKPVEVADAIIDWVIGDDFYTPSPTTIASDEVDRSAVRA